MYLDENEHPERLDNGIFGESLSKTRFLHFIFNRNHPERTVKMHTTWLESRRWTTREMKGSRERRREAEEGGERGVSKIKE